jgi:DNA-binding PadR family transcriptional regulator
MKFDHQGWHGHHPRWRRLDHGEGHREGFSRHHHDGHGGFGGRGEGRRRFFERGEFKIALLELLAQSSMHGYQFIKAMEEKTGGLYTPSAGSIYPNLQLLEDMKLIRSSEEDGRKLYSITEEGLTYLRDNAGTEKPENRWKRHEHHRDHDGPRGGRRDLKEFMKEWSEVIYLMERAGRAAKEDPALMEPFQNALDKLQEELKAIIASGTQSGEAKEEASDLPTDGNA